MTKKKYSKERERKEFENIQLERSKVVLNELGKKKVNIMLLHKKTFKQISYKTFYRLIGYMEEKRLVKRQKSLYDSRTSIISKVR